MFRLGSLYNATQYAHLNSWRGFAASNTKSLGQLFSLPSHRITVLLTLVSLSLSL